MPSSFPYNMFTNTLSTLTIVPFPLCCLIHVISFISFCIYCFLWSVSSFLDLYFINFLFSISFRLSTRFSVPLYSSIFPIFYPVLYISILHFLLFPLYSIQTLMLFVVLYLIQLSNIQSIPLYWAHFVSSIARMKYKQLVRNVNFDFGFKTTTRRGLGRCVDSDTREIWPMTT